MTQHEKLMAMATAAGQEPNYRTLRGQSEAIAQIAASSTAAKTADAVIQKVLSAARWPMLTEGEALAANEELERRVLDGLKNESSEVNAFQDGDSEAALQAIRDQAPSMTLDECLDAFTSWAIREIRAAHRSDRTDGLTSTARHLRAKYDANGEPVTLSNTRRPATKPFPLYTDNVRRGT